MCDDCSFHVICKCLEYICVFEVMWIWYRTFVKVLKVILWGNWNAKPSTGFTTSHSAEFLVWRVHQEL